MRHAIRLAWGKVEYWWLTIPCRKGRHDYYETGYGDSVCGRCHWFKERNRP